MDDIQETQLDGAQKTRPENPSHYKLESVGDQSSLPDDEELQMVEQRDTRQLENEILNGKNDIAPVLTPWTCVGEEALCDPLILLFNEWLMWCTSSSLH
jgi:hypothetical protein